MRFGEIVSSAKYRIDEQLKNLPNFGIFIFFEIEKILKIYQFYKL